MIIPGPGVPPKKLQAALTDLGIAVVGYSYCIGLGGLHADASATVSAEWSGDRRVSPEGIIEILGADGYFVHSVELSVTQTRERIRGSSKCALVERKSAISIEITGEYTSNWPLDVGGVV